MNPSFPKRYTLIIWSLASTLAFFALPATAQTVIGGDTIDASAMLDVQASDKGILLPRLSTAQRNAMPRPAKGLLIFNTDENCIQLNGGTPQAPAWDCLTALPGSGNQQGSILYWDGSSWVRLPPGQPGQQLALSPQGNPVWTGATFPVVTTLPIGSVTHQFAGEVPVFQATIGAYVSSDGGGPLLGKGVVCSTDDNPTLANAPKFIHGLGVQTGTLSGSITELSAGTTYKCRAYAFNSSGTVYGEQQTFTTSPQGAVSGLNCAGASLSAQLVAGKSPDGVVLTIPYSGGNAGLYAGRSTASTGLEGLTASLASGALTLGAGNLQYVLTGTTPAAGTASFHISIGGQSCTVSQAVAPAAIASLDCAGATFSEELVAGKPATGITAAIPYTGGNGGRHAGQSIASTGVTGLSATLLPANFAEGAGSLAYAITGTPSGPGTASFALNIGGRSCMLTRTVLPGAIASLDCAGAIHQGDLYSNLLNASSTSIPYTGGNGGNYAGQSIASTGVTGLTATLSPGNFAQGTGSLTYTITGTPSSTGTASFTLTIGGRSCTLTRIVLEPVALFTMKNIPAGSFSMGCDPNFDEDCGGESPVRTVTLSAFQIGETELTQAQWQAVMGSNPSYNASCASCPVEQVSWYDAVVFCNRLSEVLGLTPCYYTDAGFTQVYGKSGTTWSLPNGGEVYWNPTAKGYRLPTEAEWEYAAHGGNVRNWYSGSNSLGEVAWTGGYGTRPVKGKLPNGYGLYDTSGNVLEWCWDWFGIYPPYPETNPMGPLVGTSRVLRGGSWGYSDGQFYRTIRRFSYRYSDYDVGFRLVLVP